MNELGRGVTMRVVPRLTTMGSGVVSEAHSDFNFIGCKPYGPPCFKSFRIGSFVVDNDTLSTTHVRSKRRDCSSSYFKTIVCSIHRPHIFTCTLPHTILAISISGTIRSYCRHANNRPEEVMRRN